MRKPLQELLDETPDFITKEIWTDGYYDGLKDSDQIVMRSALERILYQCEQNLIQGKLEVDVHSVYQIAQEGLGLHDE